jgi:hypothetical protein
MLMAALVALAAHGADRGLRPPGSAAARQVPRWLAGVLGAAVVAAALPLGDLLELSSHGVGLIPHDVYHPFSFRTLFWIPIALAFLALSAGRPAAAAWLTAGACYIHPSAGVLAFGLLTLALLPIAARRRDHRLGLHWLGAALLAGAPALVKLWSTDLPAGRPAEIGYGAWYSSMIKDEADDFSFLYQFVFQRPILEHLFLGIGLILLLYALIVREWRREPAFWTAAALPVLFALGAGVEYLFAVRQPTAIVHLIVALTPGYRLLSFAFFPLLVLAGRLAAEVMSRGTAATMVRRVTLGAGGAVLLVLLGLTARGIENGNAGRALTYARWALQAGRVAGIDFYLEGALASGTDQFFVPPIFHLAGPAVAYPGQRDVFVIARQNRSQPERRPDHQALAAITDESFIDIVRRIRAAAPPGEGLFIPPYLRFFRDALPDHPIFFQEHHDGNLMLGSPAFLGLWRPRMEALGVEYEDMPSKYSGLMYTVMRNHWLALETDDARRLFQDNPPYPLLVTEHDHRLDFEVLARNEGFVVYDLRRPAGRAPPVADRDG